MTNVAARQLYERSSNTSQKQILIFKAAHHDNSKKYSLLKPNIATPRGTSLQAVTGKNSSRCKRKDHEELILQVPEYAPSAELISLQCSRTLRKSKYHEHVITKLLSHYIWHPFWTLLVHSNVFDLNRGYVDVIKVFSERCNTNYNFWSSLLECKRNLPHQQFWRTAGCPSEAHVCYCVLCQ